jgi:hypothetical protein
MNNTTTKLLSLFLREMPDGSRRLRCVLTREASHGGQSVHLGLRKKRTGRAEETR